MAAKPAHLVCFRVRGETYGFDIFGVREIVKAQAITSVPGSPDYVLGIINLRGKIVSVVDLSRRLGLGPSETGRTSRILVVDLDGLSVGFLVDAATEVIKLPQEEIEPAPEELRPTLREGYLAGVGKLEDRLVIILNLGELLNENELTRVEALGSGVASGAAADANP